MNDTITATHNAPMELALAQAFQASQLDEVPVGAVITLDGTVISSAHNLRETTQDPCGHAELLALRDAAQKLGRWRLTGCTLYVTLEPCLMCAGAIVLSRVDRVVYGAKDPKAGAVESLYQTLGDKKLNHRPEVISGVLEDKCSLVLKDFFAKKRKSTSQQSMQNSDISLCPDS